MKSGILLGLALVLSGGLCACPGIAEISTNSNQWQDFPILPPITNANPSIRLPLLVHVPTRLKIERTNDMLSVMIDGSSLETTNLMVGTNMVTGMEGEIYFYAEGDTRPTNYRHGLSSSLR